MRILTWLFLLACGLLNASETPTSTDQDPLYEEAVTLALVCDPEMDRTKMDAAFSRLVDRVRQELAGKVLTPPEVVTILNRHLLTDREVSYLSNLYWRDSLVTAPLIRRRGNCVATSLLYLLVGRRLGLPIRFASAPQHAYVRWEAGVDGFAIETTAKGAMVPDAVIVDLPQADLADRGFGRSLTEQETLAVLESIWASTLLGLDRDEEAGRRYAKAQTLWPDNLAIALKMVGYLAAQGHHGEATRLAEDIRTRAQGELCRTMAEQCLAGLETEARDFTQASERVHEALRGLDRLSLPTALHQLGELYRHRRLLEAGIALHRVAAALRPDAESLNHLGSALTEAHLDTEAIKAYEQVVTLNPEDFFPQVILAGLYERTGQMARGRALFASIDEPRGNRAAWLCALVWYYAVTDRPNEMLQHMRTVLDEERSHWVINYFLREPDFDRYHGLPELRTLWTEHLPPGTPLPPAPVVELAAEPEVAPAVAPPTPVPAMASPAHQKGEGGTTVLVLSLIANALLLGILMVLWFRHASAAKLRG